MGAAVDVDVRNLTDKLSMLNHPFLLFCSFLSKVVSSDSMNPFQFSGKHNDTGATEGHQDSSPESRFAGIHNVRVMGCTFTDRLKAISYYISREKNKTSPFQVSEF